ncbi:hypothetical protein DHD32_12765 [Arenibacter sp. TNZ]|uniref:hypothetical protein n=1 Tax=Arenibacter TaxID=178469 RepID=UPI000CD45898|nr:MULTISPECIES: hypothetical protein [Arenibacter]MCM4172359.1 hypothetical protein [Arenibacter sp. TNZ]
MRALAQLKNLKTDNCKHTIVRNLSRILDIRILDIDIETRTISFLYQNNSTFEKAKRELYHIGFPITQCTYQEPKRRTDFVEYTESTVSF